MLNREIPYMLEDRTGSNSASDFDDVYDRIFFRVAPDPHAPEDRHTETLNIYDIGTRSNSLGPKFHHDRKPTVVLRFGNGGALGSISFGRAGDIPMNQYLKKSSLFSGSLSRKFKASDEHEYRWAHRTVEAQEWTCYNEIGHIVAHYDLCPPGRFTASVSGNLFHIFTPYIHLTLELLTTLTIMRHIAENS